MISSVYSEHSQTTVVMSSSQAASEHTESITEQADAAHADDAAPPPTTTASIRGRSLTELEQRCRSSVEANSAALLEPDSQQDADEEDLFGYTMCKWTCNMQSQGMLYS
jgi:hypothetical protein